MSTVFDVDQISVAGGSSTSFQTSVTEVTIINAFQTPSVSIEAQTSSPVVQVEVPGMQGPPGLKNVYVQSTSPAAEHGWGEDEKGFIWIEAVL